MRVNKDILLNFRCIESTFLLRHHGAIISTICSTVRFCWKNLSGTNKNSLQYEIDPHTRNFEVFNVFTPQRRAPKPGKWNILKFVHTTTESLHTHTQGSFEKIQSLYVPQCRGHTHTQGTLKSSKSLNSTAQSSRSHTQELLNFSKSLHTTVPTHREIIFLTRNFSEKIFSSMEILENSLYRFFRKKNNLSSTVILTARPIEASSKIVLTNVIADVKYRCGYVVRVRVRVRFWEKVRFWETVRVWCGCGYGAGKIFCALRTVHAKKCFFLR